MIKKAKQSQCTHKVAAFAFSKRGNLLAFSTNKFRFDKKRGGLHAEMCVLRSAGKGVKTILICRVSNTGKLKPIEPCAKCKKVCDQLGIAVISIGDNHAR